MTAVLASAEIDAPISAEELIDAYHRFWDKVDASGDCWEWLAGKSAGYGAYCRRHGEMVRAHRFVWEILVGPIPAGMVIDHLCRNPGCVNPDHLRVVTARDNTLAGYSSARFHASKTHCPQGHPYIPSNIYRQPDGGRKCRQCGIDRCRARKAQRRGGIRAALRDRGIDPEATRTDAVRTTLVARGKRAAAELFGED